MKQVNEEMAEEMARAIARGIAEGLSSGTITAAQILRLLKKKPGSNDGRPRAKLIGLIPKGCTASDFSLTTTGVVYRLDKMDGTQIVVRDKMELGPYAKVDPIKLDGKLVFRRLDSKEQAYLMVDQQSYGPFDAVGLPAKLESTLIFQFMERGKWHVAWADKKSNALDLVLYLTSANDQPLYVAEEWCPEKGGPHFVVWGVVDFDRFSEVRRPIIAGGQPLYPARRGDKWLLVWGHEKFHRALDDIGYYTVVDGRPLFTARRQDRWFVVWDQRELPAWPEILGQPMIYSGDVLYQVRALHKVRLIWGEQRTLDCDEIFSVAVEGDEIVFGARKRRKLLKVRWRPK